MLTSLKTLVHDGRDEVVLPSYTCYSVAASTIRAGLRPRIVDIVAETLDFDLEKLGNLDFRKVVAIVVSNLYGLPGRLPDIQKIARDNGVFLVDDAAQSLGAYVGGLPSGSWGDAGLLSFDKGKPLSTIEGGAVVTSSEPIAHGLARLTSTLKRPGAVAALEQVMKLGAYTILLRPSLYWIPNAVPFLGLGQTEYRTDFALQRQSRPLAALAAAMWPRLSQFTASRVANAARYLAQIPGTPAASPVRAVDGARPTYLRFPILVSEGVSRTRILADMQRAGVGASLSYPASLADIPALRPMLAGEPDAAVGRSIASRIVTLPTHPYVSSRDVDRAMGVLLAAGTRRGHS